MLVFFFQAEDGIRDIGVTGVQTCALPISGLGGDLRARPVTIVGLHYRVTVVWTYVPQRLLHLPRTKGLLGGVFRLLLMLHLHRPPPLRARRTCPEIGRASCRESV